MVARRLGCEWETAKRRIYNNKRLTALFLAEQERMNDVAEQVLLKSIQDGNTQDAKWWLARTRRDRFSERKEHSHSGQVSIVNVDWEEDEPTNNN